MLEARGSSPLHSVKGLEGGAPRRRVTKREMLRCLRLAGARPSIRTETATRSSVHKGHGGKHLWSLSSLNVEQLARRSLAKEGWTFPMFPLHTTAFPSSASDLERLLNESLQRLFATQSRPVTVRDHSYPHLEAITISLDNARLGEGSPRPSPVSGETSPALEIDRFTLSASPLSVGPVALDLSLAAREVQLHQGKDSNDQIALSLDSATDGNIEISVTRADLETLVAKLAQDQAKKHGITIEGVQLKLRQENAHSIAAEVHLRARKLFLSASIRVTGRLDLDDQLNLKLSGLNCTGDGGIATVACGILTPYLRKVDGREFHLMSLPLGKIRLRDVQSTVGDKLVVTAEFGSAT